MQKKTKLENKKNAYIDKLYGCFEEISYVQDDIENIRKDLKLIMCTELFDISQRDRAAGFHILESIMQIENKLSSLSNMWEGADIESMFDRDCKQN